jgi:hypothetical protein
MRVLLRGFAVTAMVVAPLLAAPTPAQASCVEDSGPAGSDIVFVGSAEEERRGYTRMVVEEVWHGPDLAPEVWLLSGQKQPPFPISLLQTVGSSVDAELVEGDGYVIGATEAFHTSVCSIEELSGPTAQAPGRPESPREPVAEGLAGVDPPAGPWEIGLVSAAVVLAAGGLVQWLRSRRRRQPAEAG